MYSFSNARVDAVRLLIQIGGNIKRINGSMSNRATSNNALNVAKRLPYLHDKYVVPADKAPNNIVLVCKSHYIDCLTKELGIVNSLGNPAYTPTTLAKEEILDNHRSFFLFCSFRTTTKDEELDLPSPFLGLNCRSVLTNSVRLLRLPIAPRNFFPN